MIVAQTIQGLVGGLVYSVSGWLKAHPDEGFDLGKMLPTLLISAIIGAIAGFTSQDYGVVANSSIALSLTAVIQKLWGAGVNLAK